MTERLDDSIVAISYVPTGRRTNAEPGCFAVDIGVGTGQIPTCSWCRGGPRRTASMGVDEQESPHDRDDEDGVAQMDRDVGTLCLRWR